MPNAPPVPNGKQEYAFVSRFGASVLAPGMIPGLRRSGRRLSIRRFDPGGPYFRYALISLIIVWLIAFMAVRILPNEYISRATLVVPGGSTNVNVSLESIGQTSTSPTSAYNTGSLSPKVIYKEMAQSESVRADAAKSLGMSLDEYGYPRIRLIDETALILIEFRANSPEGAQQRASALITSLQKQLDTLRNDELESRSDSIRHNLKVYEESVNAARQRITALQGESGLLSLTQFNEISSSLELKKRRIVDLRAEVDKIEGEQKILKDRVGVSIEQAAVALQLTADPALAKLVNDYAETTALYNVEKLRFGPAHPTLMLLKNKWSGLVAQINEALRRAKVKSPGDLNSIVLLANNTHQAELYKLLINNESALAGKRQELVTTQADVTRLESELKTLSVAASKFEDLKKEHLVAEAVFTSAMARLNTSKSDIYGSYPLVQTIAAPNLPTRLGTNGPVLAFTGGITGTILISIAWFLTWLRAEFVRNRLRKA